MKVGIISVFMDYHRKGAHHRGVLQPQVGGLIAGVLPADAEIDVINDAWEDPDWTKDYDLLFISSLHSDFDRARQIAHYWRRRGAKTVYGGPLASTYPHLCAAFFDAVAIGDPEGTVPKIYDDFCRRQLKPVYISTGYDPARVPVPRFDLLAKKQVFPLSLEATRGCPFACDFCALTALGTRHHTRPVEMVIRDIKEGQRMLRGIVPAYKLNKVVFNDNNIGGNICYLRKLCDELSRQDLIWGSAITFNALSNPEIVKMLSHSGCRFMFMGLESFNKETIADMKKFQNSVDDTRRVIDQCRDNGILIVSGLVISPETDDLNYIQTIPLRLKESGLHVPGFISFECPFPGTPYFHRLACEDTPAFLPNSLLRDFNAYTLVTRPKRVPLEDLIETYKSLLTTTYSKRARLRKLADDLSHFLPGGYLRTAIADLIDQSCAGWHPHPDRTYIAGSDVPPPESRSVPLVDADFESEDEWEEIMQPWRVTDEAGRVLPVWAESSRVYGARGRKVAAILQ